MPIGPPNIKSKSSLRSLGKESPLSNRVINTFIPYSEAKSRNNPGPSLSKCCKINIRCISKTQKTFKHNKKASSLGRGFFIKQRRGDKDPPKVQPLRVILALSKLPTAFVILLKSKPKARIACHKCP